MSDNLTRRPAKSFETADWLVKELFGSFLPEDESIQVFLSGPLFRKYRESLIESIGATINHLSKDKMVFIQDATGRKVTLREELLPGFSIRFEIDRTNQ